MDQKPSKDKAPKVENEKNQSNLGKISTQMNINIEKQLNSTNNKKAQKNINLISVNCASKDATIFVDSP